MENSLAINFASILKYDNNKYEKMEQYIENCKTSLPFTPYFGYFKDKDLKALEKAAKYFDLDFFIPVELKDIEYRFVIVKHKIVYSKNFFVHFNPLERIQLSKKVLMNENKSEWNDPKIILELDDFDLKKYLKVPKKININQLPFEIKLQMGCYFADKEEQELFMSDFINELQNEVKEDDYSLYECDFTKDIN